VTASISCCPIDGAENGKKEGWSFIDCFQTLKFGHPRSLPVPGREKHRDSSSSPVGCISQNKVSARRSSLPVPMRRQRILCSVFVSLALLLMFAEAEAAPMHRRRNRLACLTTNGYNRWKRVRDHQWRARFNLRLRSTGEWAFVGCLH